MHRVLVADKLAEDGLALLRAAPQVETTVRTDWSPATLATALREAEAVLVRSAVRITADLLADPGSLRLIARAGVGVDNIDVDAATRAGVLVVNTPDANTLSTAEHAWALLLALARNVVPACQSVRSGRWDRAAFAGVQLAGKTLGVVGLGRIGRAVARRALAFEMNVVGYDPAFPRQSALEGRVAMYPALGELFARCDFVTLHAALTDQSRGLVSADVLRRARPGLRLVNCARAELVDDAALVEAVRSGRLAGVATDVFAVEPPPRDHPLLGLDRVICTPHLGATTAEAQAAVSVEAAQIVLDYLLRGQIRGAVNLADLPADMTPRDRAYVDLAARMGTVLSALCPGGFDRLTVTTSGDGLAHLVPTLRRCALVTLLSRHLDCRISIVNADAVAAEQGIDVRLVRRPEPPGPTEPLEMQLASGQRSHEIEATIFVDGLPRILRIDGYRMNLEAAGDMLLLFNDDRPGVIGVVGTVLGRHNVNVADMALSRHARRALMVLKLDAPAPQVALDELRQHEAVISVHTACLPPVRA